VSSYLNNDLGEATMLNDCTHYRWHRLIVFAIMAWSVGCAAPGKKMASSPISDQVAIKRHLAPSPPEKSPITAAPVAYLSSPHLEAVKDEKEDSQDFYTQDPADPFQGQTTLEFEQLKREVQARNPTLQVMIAAWRAAAERYPQEISLEDPMFGYMIGVSGIGPDGGYMVEASQKLPWFGKRQLRGEKADYEAWAVSRDVEEVRLMLTEAAANAYLDYYLARRELELNAANLELLREFRQIAQVRYEANQVTQQDILQTNIELADAQGRQAELIRQERVAVARINTLMHRGADSRLPPPVEKLATPDVIPPVEVLRETALSKRPDLSAEAARIKVEEANVALACKEFYPDFEVVAKYDAFMTPDDMRPQVGMNMSVPLWRDKRHAAWREATAKLQQHRTTYAEKADRARYEVQSSYAMLLESRQLLGLYAEKILPSVEDNIHSAQANYTAGKVDFLRLIEAARQYYREQERYYQTLSDYHRRLAEMNRVVGGYAF
jgi:outer membrane protein, heavy metal efflux system